MLHQIDLSRTDLNLLVLFEAVMETRHVGRAAERLNLSPSAVSHGLGRLRMLLDDPLFLRASKGMTPTDRAAQIEPVVAEILARVRQVMASARPFDPAASVRRFAIGAPDGVSSVVLPLLLARLAREAPGVDVSIRQLLPKAGETSLALAWPGAIADLETRAVDVAILPLDRPPARFAARTLYREDFVVSARAGHSFFRRPTLSNYCAMQHLVVSSSGDPSGFVDAALAERGLSRRVALTVPNFMFALAVLADTDLICALPRRFAALQGPRFGVASVEAALDLPRFSISAITPAAAQDDAGVAWLVRTLADVLA